MQLQRLGKLLGTLVAAAGCQTTPTANAPIEPAPICRVVQRQELPESRTTTPGLRTRQAPEDFEKPAEGAPDRTRIATTKSRSVDRTLSRSEVTPTGANASDGRLAAADVGRAASPPHSVRQAQHVDDPAAVVSIGSFFRVARIGSTSMTSVGQAD